MNCHFLIPQYYLSFWSQLTGLNLPESYGRESIAQIDKEVPLLLVDTCAYLIQLLFALPLNIDEKYFDSIVQNLYNLTVVQSIGQLSCFFTEEERSTMRNQINKDELFNCESNMINYVINYFEINNSNFYSCMDEGDHLKAKKWSSSELRDLLIKMCLPFIRLASLLKCFLFNREYPSFSKLTDEQFNKAEYPNLIRILNLKISTTNNIEDAFLMPYFICSEPIELLNTWLNQYSLFLDRSLIVATVIKK